MGSIIYIITEFRLFDYAKGRPVSEIQNICSRLVSPATYTQNPGFDAWGRGLLKNRTLRLWSENPLELGY